MADTEFNDKLIVFDDDRLAGAEWERAPTGRMVRIVELYRVGNVRAGIWEGEPGKTVIESHPYDEYCTVTAGELVVTDAAGNQKVFMKGDSFALPKGFKGFWDVRQRVRKNYFISE